MEAVMSSSQLKLQLIFLLSFLTFFHLSLSVTLVVDGISPWNNPTVQLGDSIIFRHKYKYKLYIFQNRRAFNLCNFTQASLLTKSNQTSSFTWHPSRLGLFYFSFNNGSTKACQDGQKLAIEVSSSMPPQISASSPELQPPTLSPPQAPPPTLGGTVSSSPAYPWPFGPRESTAAPGPSPSSESFSATSPSMVGSGSIPFINSNPAVPLPTGEIDSATIRPVPTSSNQRVQVVGLQAVLRTVFCVFFMMLL